MTPATLVRLTVGGLLLAAPHRVLAGIHAPDRDDPPVLVAARVLGARLVVQGALDVAAHGRFRRIGAAVEAAHAASMVPVATRSPWHRRSAGTSAAVATGLALADLATTGGAASSTARTGQLWVRRRFALWLHEGC